MVTAIVCQNTDNIARAMKSTARNEKSHEVIMKKNRARSELCSGAQRNEILHTGILLWTCSTVLELSITEIVPDFRDCLGSDPVDGPFSIAPFSAEFIRNLIPWSPRGRTRSPVSQGESFRRKRTYVNPHDRKRGTNEKSSRLRRHLQEPMWNFIFGWSAM
jgi:hypothetical protein